MLCETTGMFAKVHVPGMRLLLAPLPAFLFSRPSRLRIAAFPANVDSFGSETKTTQVLLVEGVLHAVLHIIARLHVRRAKGFLCIVRVLQPLVIDEGSGHGFLHLCRTLLIIATPHKNFFGQEDIYQNPRHHVNEDSVFRASRDAHLLQRQC